jgi:hypothetical protein
MDRTASRSQFAKSIGSELEQMLTERRVQLVAFLLGAFGVTATPVFKIKPWWIGPAVLALLLLALIGEAAFRAWRVERRRSLRFDAGRASEFRTLSVDSLFALHLAAGTALLDFPIVIRGTASGWEKAVARLIEAAYGLKAQALFLQDRGSMADETPGFDPANTRKVLEARRQRLIQLMNDPPPLRSDFNPDDYEWKEQLLKSTSVLLRPRGKASPDT